MKKLRSRCRPNGSGSPSMMVTGLMLLLLLNMTGCASPSVVVIPGGESITVQKQTVDNLYSDNEALLKALEQCKNRER